jgi:radical SAM protein with 4Fe4S-binding SPASM domain
MKRKKGIMHPHLFMQMIDEISGWNRAVEIVPEMFGEFFLNPDWKEYLAYIAYRLPNAAISLPTNGSRVDDEALDFLVKIPNIKFVSFSVYAHTPGVYHELIGLPVDTIAKVKHAIERLTNERPDIAVRMGATLDPEFMNNRTEIEQMSREFDVSIDVHSIIRNHAYHGYEHSPPEIDSCGSVFDVMVVLWDGRVVSCCFDPEAENVLGDATKSTLAEIWNGEAARDLRTKHAIGQRQEIPLCRSCSL